MKWESNKVVVLRARRAEENRITKRKNTQDCKEGHKKTTKRVGKERKDSSSKIK